MKFAWCVTALAPILLLHGLLLPACSGGQRGAMSCGNDSDCKGGRICNEHFRCSEPASNSAAFWGDAGMVSERVEDADVFISGPPPYAMFGGNAQHTGLLGGAAPVQRPKELWRFDAGGPIVGSPSVGPDGRLFVSSHDHFLRALSPAGALLWSFESGDRIWSTPAIAEDGTIYVGSDDDHLYAIDSSNGKEKWRFRIGACAEPLGFGPEGTRCDVDGGPTIGADGTIYVGGDGLYAIWPNGTLRWKFATSEHVSTAPAISPDGSRIYIGSQDDAVYAVRSDGTKDWEFRTGRDVESAIAIGPGGEIYFGSDDDAIYALSSQGDLLWKVITSDDVRASPSIGSDGTVYVGSYDGKLYAIDGEGMVKWRFTAADKIHGAVGVARNHVLIFGSQDDNLYAVAAEDGRLLWYLPLDSDVDPTPALTPDGILYVVGDDGSVRAFQ